MRGCSVCHCCLPLFLSSLLGPHNQHGAKLIGRWRCLGSQVYSHGLRVIMKGQPPQEWRAPGKKQIEKACANERQVVLALAGGEIIFFELDEAMQNIQASTAQPEALTRVTCRAIDTPVPTCLVGCLSARDFSWGL